MGLGIKEIIGDKREAILAAAAKYGVENVRIFGSVVRGEATEDSDVDLLLNIRNTDFFAMLDFKYAAEKLLNRKVDTVSDRGLSPYISPIILSEVQPL